MADLGGQYGNRIEMGANYYINYKYLMYHIPFVCKVKYKLFIYNLDLVEKGWPYHYCQTFDENTNIFSQFLYVSVLHNISFLEMIFQIRVGKHHLSFRNVFRILCAV